MGGKPTKVVDAEVEAIRQKAAAEVQKLQAEAAAVTMRATADAAATAADAATRAKAAEAATRADTLRKYAPLVAATSVGTLLLLDLVFHDVRRVHRWRMMRKLRALQLPPTAAAAPRVQLSAGVVSLNLGPMPTMLLGPTGSGKSMKLAQTARETVAPPAGSSAPPCPAAYLRMRQPKTGADGSSDSSSDSVASGSIRADASASDTDASARLEAIAILVFEQLGYPSRTSLLSQAWARLHHVKVLDTEWQLYRGKMQRDRLVVALRLLFDVAERLYIERKAAGIPEEHAPIVLLFDEVQDLIKDYRLAKAGGRFVFEELAVLLVAYGIDRRVVRAAVAGSSAHLAMEFDTTVANDARWRYKETSDPTPDTIMEALTLKGYSEQQASGMVKLVGTRLRLLEDPLEKGAATCSYEEFVNSAHAFGVRSFAHLLSQPSVPKEAKDSLLDILQRIVAHEAGHGEAPTWYQMPESLRALQFSRMLYVRLDGSLTFQSQLHRNVWAELSKKYVHQMQ